MEHGWTRKGKILLAVGFLIHPSGVLYRGYKLIPEYGGRNMRLKPRVEICKGALHRAYSPVDKVIYLRTKLITTNEYPTNEEAADSIRRYFNKKLLDGWTIVKPAYAHTILNTPWKNIRQVRLSSIRSSG